MSILKTFTSKENNKFDYDSRLNRLLNITKETILITKNENIFYLTGFKGTAGWLLIYDSKKYLFVDSRYFEVASKITHKTTVVLVANTYQDALADFIKENNIKEITVAKNALYLTDYENVVAAMVNNSIKVSISKADIDSIRIVKEKEEINIIKENLHSAEKAMIKMTSHAQIRGHALIKGNAKLTEFVCICENSRIEGDVVLSGDTIVKGNTHISTQEQANKVIKPCICKTSSNEITL